MKALGAHHDGKEEGEDEHDGAGEEPGVDERSGAGGPRHASLPVKNARPHHPELEDGEDADQHEQEDRLLVACYADLASRRLIPFAH